MKTDKIIDDYINCNNFPKCQECEAHYQIKDTPFTFCIFLRRYTRRLKEMINEVIGGNG